MSTERELARMLRNYFTPLGSERRAEQKFFTDIRPLLYAFAFNV